METPEETALREVLEETNYHIRLTLGFSEAIQYVLPRGEEKRVVFYLGKAVKKGNSRINPREISSVRWFDYADALEIMSFDNSREVLAKAHAFLTDSPEVIK